MAIAVVLILTSFLGSGRVSRPWLWIERLLLVVLGLACAVQEVVIGFWMSSIRTQAGGPIDSIAADDPLRIRFDDLHEKSVWVLMAAMAAALITFFIISNRTFAAAKAEIKSDIYDFSKEF